MPIYMQYPGCNGSVTTKGYEKWIELESAQFGMNRPMDSRLGNASYASSGKLQISEIHISKSTDNASPQLAIQAMQGKFDSKVKITFVTTTAQGVSEILRYDLTDTGISSFQLSGGSAGAPMESYSLSFSKFEFTFHGMDKSAAANPQRGGYDLAAAKSL